MDQLNTTHAAAVYQVLSHPWFIECGAAVEYELAPVPELLLRMRAFSSMNALKKQAAKVCLTL